MFKWLDRARYRKEVIKHIKFCLLIDPRQLNPNINIAIDDGYKNKRDKAELAVNIVGSILTIAIGNIPGLERRKTIGEAILNSYEDPDMVSKFAAEAVVRIKANVKKTGKPVNLDDIQWRLQFALICVTTLYENKLITEMTRSWFFDEIGGALDGLSSGQRRSERISNALHTAFNLPELRAGADDSGPLLRSEKVCVDMPPLSGVEHKVKLVATPTGRILLKESDGQQITDRRSLTQEHLQKVPPDAHDCVFVNLPAPHDQMYSCIVAQPDSQIFGDMRAFWWFLAKHSVGATCIEIDSTRMTASAFGDVYNSARGMWDAAIEHAGSIDQMRDQIVPLRNVHLEVISQMKATAAEDRSRCLGLDIALAMVLATQSEDRKLEAFAFKSFKRFLWQPGEEPHEFHLNAAG